MPNIMSNKSLCRTYMKGQGHLFQNEGKLLKHNMDKQTHFWYGGDTRDDVQNVPETTQ